MLSPPQTAMCMWELTRPGIMVLPETSTRVAPGGIWTAAAGPTAWTWPLAMTSVACSMGALPVPSMSRAPVSATVALGACASERWEANPDKTSNVPAETTATRVEMRLISDLLCTFQRHVIQGSRRVTLIPLPPRCVNARRHNRKALLRTITRPLVIRSPSSNAAVSNRATEGYLDGPRRTTG